MKQATRRAFVQQIAPQYQQASAPQKKKLLEGFLRATGYARKYAIWLLNHANDAWQLDEQDHHQYSPAVQQALVLAWQTLNRICAKRLIPFLPDILASLEQHGHLQLDDESRHQLLSISAATADRLLRAHRQFRPRGVSTTKAGPLLKQQIPIRTFAQWNEAQPGFVEADLVAHCGGHLEGGCLYTLTLTDIATGWTECWPVLNRGCEAVLAALHRARALFPFPILGIDTDNGGEFINEEVAAYCAREQITFTRGRPYQKRDQCFVEQKNGVVVRQVVGYGRLMGEQACRQLAELYRALRLYVNCFQPSMKLLAKHVEGRTVRRVYDAAKTPLQRLLLADSLPASKQQDLRVVAKALDPLRLFHQVQLLQQAVLRCDVTALATTSQATATALLTFRLEECALALLPTQVGDGDRAAVPQKTSRPPQEFVRVPGWRRSRNDPFAGQWEQICALVQANPTRSSGAIFRELQSLFPGRYQPQHLRSLQRGVRQIRASLLQTREEPEPGEAIQGDLPTAIMAHSHKQAESEVPALIQPEDASARETPAALRQHHARGAEPGGHFPESATAPSANKLRQATPTLSRLSSRSHEPHAASRGRALTIERAIHFYLQAHRHARRSAKTLEWHQTALRQLQHYLLAERHLLEARQIMETDLAAWVASLAQTPTRTGKPRSANTIETYARSARAFCAWLVQRGDLAHSPMSEEAFPHAGVPLPHLIQPDAFEQFLGASFPSDVSESKAKSLVARDRALLWVLFDTGISVCEVCALRVCDLDQKTGTLRVWGKGGKERSLVLGPRSLDALRALSDKSHVPQGRSGAEKSAGHEPLFGSERGGPLTKNSLALLFRRLRERAGSSNTPICPQILRHSFALRYLQVGGDPRGLQELLGYAGMAQVRQYVRWHDQLVHDQMRQEREGI